MLVGLVRVGRVALCSRGRRVGRGALRGHAGEHAAQRLLPELAQVLLPERAVRRVPHLAPTLRAPP